MSTPPARAEVLAAVPTLFDDGGEVDAVANAALLRHLSGRVDGVFVAGTTGEFPALDRSERRALAEAALAEFGAPRVVVHVGAASTREAVALARDAVAAGAERLAVLTPYYLPVDVDAVQAHFAAVTAAAPRAAVYAYLFPERSGVHLDPAEFARIVAATDLAGAKLSGAAAGELAAHRAALPPDVALWSGADTALAQAVRDGGAGAVSGLSSAFPEPFTAIATAVAARDPEAERAAQARADRVQDVLGGAPERIKHALRELGIGGGGMRMPAPRVDPATAERIRALVAEQPLRTGA